MGPGLAQERIQPQEQQQASFLEMGKDSQARVEVSFVPLVLLPRVVANVLGEEKQVPLPLPLGVPQVPVPPQAPLVLRAPQKLQISLVSRVLGIS